MPYTRACVWVRVRVCVMVGQIDADWGHVHFIFFLECTSSFRAMPCCAVPYGTSCLGPWTDAYKNTPLPPINYKRGDTAELPHQTRMLLGLLGKVPVVAVVVCLVAIAVAAALPAAAAAAAASSKQHCSLFTVHRCCLCSLFTVAVAFVAVTVTVVGLLFWRCWLCFRWPRSTITLPPSPAVSRT